LKLQTRTRYNQKKQLFIIVDEIRQTPISLNLKLFWDFGPSDFH
jgi:hypothetical protein